MQQIYFIALPKKNTKTFYDLLCALFLLSRFTLSFLEHSEGKKLHLMRILIDYNYDIMIGINSAAIFKAHHHYVHLFVGTICKLICENYDVENNQY